MSLNLVKNPSSSPDEAILNALPALILVEQQDRILFANVAARKLLGNCEGPWKVCLQADLLGELPPIVTDPAPFEAQLRCPGGKRIEIQGTRRQLEDERGLTLIVAHPREGAAGARMMEEVLNCIPDAVVLTHGYAVVYSNPAFGELFGYDASQIVGLDLRDLIVPDTRQHESATIETILADLKPIALESVRRTSDGKLIDVSVVASPLMVTADDGTRSRLGTVFNYRDISERKQAEAKLQHDALHDLLTGLPNRALFLDRLTVAFSRRARRPDQSCGVLFIDMDHFKQVNDTLGHAAGDSLLRQVAQRLQSALRPQDTAARLGGDEFAIVVENITSSSDLEVVANRILLEMDRPFEILQHRVQGGASIGVALAGPDHTTPEMLIRDADFAMYRAKHEGGSRYEIFDKNLKLHANNRRERERQLRHVLDRREFELWYQPIVRLANGQLEGFEALLRHRRSDGQVDSFRDLLAVAEETGLSITIGRETVESACRQLRQWSEISTHPLSITVNLSERQFYHLDMVAQIKRLLAASGAPPRQLLFEVSEQTLARNPEQALVLLQKLNDCDVRVAIDNFGTHNGSLNQLMLLPISVIKLAPRLSQAAVAGGRQAALLAALLQMGTALQIEVVAQGIETAEQFTALRNLGCQLGQGYCLSHPLDPRSATELAVNLDGLELPA